MRGLSPRQLQTLRVVAYQIRLNGTPPTLREIGACLGITTTNGVSDHLNALERKGLIRRAPMLSRAITILDAAAPYIADLQVATHRPVVPVIRPLRCNRCGCVTFAADSPCFGCRLLRAERVA